MRKLITSIILAVSGVSFTASAQAQLPERLDGYFRLTNTAFQEALTAKSSYNLGGAIPNPADAGSVFNITTGKMWSFAEEMERLQQMLDEGKITEEQYTLLFMSAMNVNSWKSGFFPVTGLTVQGQDFVKLINRFPDWADAAIEYFLNNEVANLYSEHRGTLTMLCAFATDIIKPVNLDSEESFRKWTENYLTKWRAVADFGLYLHPVWTTPDPEDDKAVSEPTGEYYLEFKTPPYVGSMEKAQMYINKILTGNGSATDVDTLNIWGSAKQYMMAEMAKEYAEDSPEYTFVHNLLGDSKMNTLYIIGESEEGGLRIQELPDAFNTQNVIITADDIARCTWKFEQLDEEYPFAAAIKEKDYDKDGWHYGTLNLTFPCRMLSPGMEAYYATAVNEETAEPAMERLSGDIIPAYTPVILRNMSADAADNKLLPLEESDVENPTDNILKGTVFAEENVGFYTLAASENGPLFKAHPEVVAANTAYYDGEIVNVSAISSSPAGEVKIYDLLGREVKDTQARGLYIINGKKVVK